MNVGGAELVNLNSCNVKVHVVGEPIFSQGVWLRLVP